MPQGMNRQADSMLEGLQGLLGAIGPLMTTPDADPQFLMMLQQAIVGKVKEATTKAAQGTQQQPNQNAPGGGGGMTGMGAGMGAPGGPMENPAAGMMLGDMGGGGMPGGPAEPGEGAPGAGGMGMPNPDELRRVLGANAQVG